jgi:hypothetical protein
VILAGRALARRLEWVEGANDCGCVPAGGGSAVEAIGGGWAVFAGADSPLSRAIGLGLSDPAGEREVEAVERFFHSRGGKASFDLCPLADPALLEALGRRGYCPVEFNSVLVRELNRADAWPEEPTVRLAQDFEQDLWSSTVGRAFFESPVLSAAELEIGRAIFRGGDCDCYLATGDLGQVVGGGALSMREGVALLFADGIVPEFRRKGLHGALIRLRLEVAGLRGCDLACATAAPGSGSQRNFERAGFRVAYTKVVLVER